MRDLNSTKRIVIKIGSSSLTYPDTHKLNLDKIDLLAREISDLMNSGKKVVLVYNLQPAKLCGIESQGMLLCAEKDGKVCLISPEKDMPSGSTVR